MKNAPFRIFILVLIAGIVGIAAVAVLMSDIITLSDSYRVITDEYFENMKDASDIRMLLHRHQAAVSKHVFTDEEEQYASYESEAQETAERLKDIFSDFGKRMSGGDKERIYHNAYTEFLSYLQNSENAVTFSRAGNKGTASYYLLTIMDGNVKKVNSAFDELDEFTSNEIAAAKEQMSRFIHISIVGAVVSVIVTALSVVITSVLCFRITSGLNRYKDDLERSVAEQTTVIRAQNEQNEQLLSQTVFALANAVDAKDNYTSGHSRRVAEYAMLIAERMGKSREEQEEIYRTGLLHDVGKIRVPEEIINKTGKLTEDEFAMIKLHPITGYHILKDVSSEKMFADGVRFHHERYDGKGYPNGLSGNQIPEIARIVGVADAYDAMASRRSYRDIMPQEAVRNEIVRGRGTQFDPAIADIMLKLIDEDKDYQMKEAMPACRKILAVDDEVMNIKLITIALKDVEYYEVTGVDSGEKAIEALRGERFDIALIDVKMPGMDGYETVSKIREFCDIPVVFMSVDRGYIDMEELKKYDVTDFITKPFMPPALKEILHAVLSE